jgi:hypothetical protein
MSAASRMPLPGRGGGSWSRAKAAGARNAVVVIAMPITSVLLMVFLVVSPIGKRLVEFSRAITLAFLIILYSELFDLSNRFLNFFRKKKFQAQKKHFFPVFGFFKVVKSGVG